MGDVIFRLLLIVGGYVLGHYMGFREGLHEANRTEPVDPI